MTSIVGIPTTRVSDMFISKQMLGQVQQNLLSLYETETQLTTGHAFQVASENPVAAMNVVSLQSLLERKGQAASNLASTASFLSAADSALSRVSDSMSDIRGTALSVVGTTATDLQRDSAAIEVSAAVSQLVNTGNQTFRSRYLFAGSNTAVQPFVITSSGLVEYVGNESQLYSYCDVNSLVSSSVSGAYAFGAISEAVQGTTDLSIALSSDTRLADLNNGDGVRLGSISVQVGTQLYTVDLSSATTVEDVAQMIYDQTERKVRTHVGSEGLVLDATNVLIIRDIGSGKTATDLGIVTTGFASTHWDGKALNPILTSATPLADLLGTRASAWLPQSGNNNDILLKAASNGTLLNGVEITFIDDGSVVNPHGDETAVYDGTSSPKTLVVRIADGTSTAADVVKAINNACAAGTVPFTAEIDPLEGGTGGLGAVHVTPSGEVAGITAKGGGLDFDKDSGLQIVNNNQTYTIAFSDCTTVEDFLNKLNASEAGVLAQINSTNNGIDIRSRISGCDFGIGENGGTTAEQLGVRTLNDGTSLDDLNYGSGIHRARDLVLANAVCDSGADNSAVLFTAVNTGADWDGYTIEFVDNQASPSADGLTYDPDTKTLSFEITLGTTTASSIIAMLQKNSNANAAFHGSLPEIDGLSNDGSGPVALGVWTTSRLATVDTDFTITRADGVSFGIDLSSAQTIGDVISLINNNVTNCSSGNKVRAQLAAYGNGIELVDETSGGGTLTIVSSSSSTAAVDLGLIPKGKESAKAGAYVNVGEAEVTSTNVNSSLVFNAKKPGDWATAVHVVFQATGTESVTYNESTQQLLISYEAGVTTAADIRQMVEADPLASSVFSVDYPTSDPPSDGSGVFDPLALDVPMISVPSMTLTATDTNALEVEGIFTALLRLQNALETSDDVEIARGITLLDSANTQFTFVRAEIGAREQSLDTVKTQLEDQDSMLQETLSLNFDADIAEVASKLALQQSVYAASMKAMAMISNMTLLDYI